MSIETVLITGASTGIGATYADRFARRGANLVLVARDRSRLQALAARLAAETGVTVEVLPADLNHPADLDRVERRLRTDPAITTLVNNAGMAGGGPVAQADPSHLEAVVRLNVLATTRLAAAAAAGFAARGRGTIINLGSVTALIAERFEPVYSATKAFVLAFSQSLRAELAPKGVRVQVVLPGVTRTEIWERAGHDLSKLPPEMVMGVDDLVDAALSGYDLGEAVTIPSLPDAADWERYEAARHALAPNLSRDRPATRYRATLAAD
jgi:uncharacterized protein